MGESKCKRCGFSEADGAQLLKDGTCVDFMNCESREWEAEVDKLRALLAEAREFIDTPEPTLGPSDILNRSTAVSDWHAKRRTICARIDAALK